MLKAENLTKRFGRFTAVDAVSFCVPERQVVGLLGQNGAGKTTLLNMLCGYLSPDTGDVMIGGFSMAKSPIQAKHQVGYLPDRPPVYPEMSVLSYLSFCCDLKNLKRQDKKRHLDEVLELTALTEVKDRIIGHLSRGYRQRVGLAQALCAAPGLLLLDEPTAGFDPSQTAAFRTLIKQLAERHTIVLSSHHLHEVEALCDRVLVLNQGHLVLDTKLDGEKPDSLQTFKLVIIGNVNELPAALRGLSGFSNLSNWEEHGSRRASCLLTLQRDDKAIIALNTLLAARGASVAALTPIKDSLEEIFLKASGWERS